MRYRLLTWQVFDTWRAVRLLRYSIEDRAGPCSGLAGLAIDGYMRNDNEPTYGKPMTVSNLLQSAIYHTANVVALNAEAAPSADRS